MLEVHKQIPLGKNFRVDALMTFSMVHEAQFS